MSWLWIAAVSWAVVVPIVGWALGRLLRLADKRREAGRTASENPVTGIGTVASAGRGGTIAGKISHELPSATDESPQRPVDPPAEATPGASAPPAGPDAVNGNFR